MGPGNKDQLEELLNHFSIEANNPAVCMGQVCPALRGVYTLGHSTTVDVCAPEQMHLVLRAGDMVSLS